MAKTKIVLDADVIIHFAKGGYLPILPSFLPGYDFIVLDTVYKEICGDTKRQLDNQIHLLKNIAFQRFEPKGEMMREYAQLIRTKGTGESACLTFCKFEHDVVGSSNLADIIDYCEKNGITYLTTIDFLYYAIKNNKLSKDEVQEFISDVNAKGSKLPTNINFDTYISKANV